MKLFSTLLVLLALGDSQGFQVRVVGPWQHRAVKSARPNHHESSSRVIGHMLKKNNDALNSNSSSSSQHQHSQHYFHNKKVNGEVAKASHEVDGSAYRPRLQHCVAGLRMAHGAICPETIAIFEKNSNPAIQRFVETYHTRGPLACEDLLSDPEVLPHLTKAMRDIHL